jgi:aerobic carbon-monoxide dehydrogenase medium subunit
VKPPPFRYRRAGSVEEAVAELVAAGGRGRVLAGGQTLVAELSARVTAPELLVDLAAVPGLDHLEIEAETVRIGAMRRIAALEHDARLTGVLPALVEAAQRIAHPAVRNRGTIGGNVAHADPASAIPPVLLAHGGEVVLSGPAGPRTVAASAFFTGPSTNEQGRTACAPDEIVVELRFPRPGPRSGAAFAEISRRARGWGLAGACAVVRLDAGGRIEELGLGLLGLAPTAVRAGDAERAARGLTPDTAAVSEIAEAAVASLDAVPADVHASAQLRRSLGRVVVRRALTEAVTRAAGA